MKQGEDIDPQTHENSLCADAEKQARVALGENKECRMSRMFGMRRGTPCGRRKTLAKMLDVVKTLVTEEQFSLIQNELKQEFPSVEAEMKHLLCLANQIDPKLAARSVSALKSKCGMPICRKRKSQQKQTSNVTPDPSSALDASTDEKSTALSISEEFEQVPGTLRHPPSTEGSACIQSMFRRFRQGGRPVGSITMASRLGNPAMVNSFIQEAFSTPGKLEELQLAVDRCGNTALHSAALGGNAEVTKLLIDNGWNPDARTLAGKTPLIVASRRGSVDVVEALVNAGASVDASDRCGCTGLIVALRAKQDNVVKALLKAGCDSNQGIPHTGMTPLMVAAVAGNVAGIQALLNAGTSQTLRSRAGYTAFLLAAKSGKLDAVVALYRGEQSRGELCNDGFNALHLASKNGHKEVVVRLVQMGFPVDGLGGFPRNLVSGDCTMTDCGAESESEGRAPKQRRQMLVADTTAMMLACEFGRTDAALVLHNMGADPCLRNKSGLSAVALADLNGHVNTVRALQLAGFGCSRSSRDVKSSALPSSRKMKSAPYSTPLGHASWLPNESYRSDVGGNATPSDTDGGDARDWQSE